MTDSEWMWKGILCWIFLINHFHIGADGRHYDKCSTPDGRQGVCVVKRYCREATSHRLLPCQDDGTYCCPIPTTERSAPPPTLATAATLTTDAPRKTAGDIEKSRYPNDSLRHDVGVSRRPISVNDKPLQERAPALPDGSRPRYDGGTNIPISDNDRLSKGHAPKVSDGNEPRYDRRSNESNTSPKIRFEDAPSRISKDRPKPVDNDRLPSESHNDNGRRPDYSSEPRLETSRHRGELDVDREERSRPKADDDSVTKYHPQASHYPSRDQIDSHRDIPPPRRTEPTRISQHNKSKDITESPIRFPEPYEFSVPQHKVPACGVKPYELFIAGGEASESHEWPWMTAIFRRHQSSRPKTFLCGGSLINTKYVLTAAHCFVNNYVILPASSFVVRLGSHLLNSGEEYTVSNLVVHHNHSGSDFFNDIALVRLASEVYITDKIAPICLPFPEMMTEDLVDRMATVAGWGDTSFRSAGTRYLQHVTVPIVSSDECFAAYSRVRGAAFLARGSDHVICAGLREGGKDACLGDSGGPLMLKTTDDRWMVIGIVSLGYKCAEPGYPGVYTRVTHYMSWIQTNMKRH